jgi:hypothetical protein
MKIIFADKTEKEIPSEHLEYLASIAHNSGIEDSDTITITDTEIVLTDETGEQIDSRKLP